MNRIKIAHVLDSFDVGGLENGVINLVNGLPNFTHVVCCISRLGASRSRVTRPAVVFYDLQKCGRDLLLPFKLAGIFRKERPHIVHTRNWGAIDAIIGAKLAGVPVIVHSEHGVDFDTLRRAKRRRILARKLLFRLTDRVFTVCHALKDRISSETGLPPDTITFILNGVDLDKYSVRPKNSKSAELGIDSRRFVIGSVGRLDLIKDYKTLLRAFKI